MMVTSHETANHWARLLAYVMGLVNPELLLLKSPSVRCVRP
jgi:hypothetical protein